MEKNIAIAGEPISLVGNENILIRGRHTVQEGALAFDWSNSGFAFCFNGSGFVLSLGEYRAEAPAYVKIIVDGGKTRQRFAVVNGSEKLMIEGLREQRHSVEVLKITEGAPKVLFKSIALIGSNPSLCLPPLKSQRHIEFIGDSITAGYGVIGRSTDPGYLTWQQDSTCSYAYLTAESFGAEGRYICISGKGIVCNCNGDRTDVKAGEYYEYLTVGEGGVCHDGWNADVVVINIGTNDSGGPASEDEFKTAVLDLISKVRTRYPESKIIWMYGLMSQYYRDILHGVISEASEKDKNLHLLVVESINGHPHEIGANGHPNVYASARASRVLFKKIRSITGWSRVTKKEKLQEEK